MKPNKIIQFYNLFLSKSDKDKKYALIMKDELGVYVWLDTFLVADAEYAAAVLDPLKPFLHSSRSVGFWRRFTYQESIFGAPYVTTSYTSKCDHRKLTVC